jgi:hypothetical protein
MPNMPKLGAANAEFGVSGIRLFMRMGLRLLVLLGFVVQLGAAQSPPQTAAEATKGDQTAGASNPASAVVEKTAGTELSIPAALEEKMKQIAASGRIQQIGESSSARLNPPVPLAPGAPPILAFRYFDGQVRHRFGNLDLVMDDAGH